MTQKHKAQVRTSKFERTERRNTDQLANYARIDMSSSPIEEKRIRKKTRKFQRNLTALSPVLLVTHKCANDENTNSWVRVPLKGKTNERENTKKLKRGGRWRPAFWSLECEWRKRKHRFESHGKGITNFEKCKQMNKSIKVWLGARSSGRSLFVRTTKIYTKRYHKLELPIERIFYANKSTQKKLKFHRKSYKKNTHKF